MAFRSWRWGRWGILAASVAVGGATSVAASFAGVRAAYADTDPAALPHLDEREREQVYAEALHVLGGNVNVVSKWTAEIRYALLAGREPVARRILQDTMLDVAVQTGLRARAVRPEDSRASTQLAAIERDSSYRLAVCDVREPSLCANFFVVVTDLDTMRGLAGAVPLRDVYRSSLQEDGSVHCFFSPRQNARREIVGAFVFVQDKLSPEMLRTCLHEEIYQSFGLFNDISGSQFFSFDNRVEPKRITAFDRALLASVYDPDVKPGAPVFAVAERFMQRIQAAAGFVK